MQRKGHSFAHFPRRATRHVEVWEKRGTGNGHGPSPGSRRPQPTTSGRPTNDRFVVQALACRPLDRAGKAQARTWTRFVVQALACCPLDRAGKAQARTWPRFVVQALACRPLDHAGKAQARTWPRFVVQALAALRGLVPGHFRKRLPAGSLIQACRPLDRAGKAQAKAWTTNEDNSQWFGRSGP